MPPLAWTSLQSSALPNMPGPSSVDVPMQDTNEPHSNAIPTVAALKRTASSAFDSPEDSSSRKKLREDSDGTVMAISLNEPSIDGQALADELEQELQCGCCSALVYRPVLVSPCQHFFCGSCVVLWIRNGGTNCPACRGISMSVTPSRSLQTVADVLSRAAPSRARSINERMQADEIYRPGLSLRIPTPRQPSPEPNVSANSNYVHPCPHCSPGNQWGWRCAQPIADPDADPESAWNADDGTPPGHAYCGNCESILALQAPTTTKCDFCQVSFCGIGIPGRCVAAPLASQHPHGLSDLADLIQCGEIYDCFDHNSVEVEIMFDYLTAQNFTPRHIYRDIIAIILRSARQFQPLFELELFMDVHGVSGGIDPDPSAPRQKVCRVCATEVLLWGLRDWWVQERKKGYLEEDVMKRPDCPEGSGCTRQKDHSHAREFNHIISPPDHLPPQTADQINQDTEGQQATQLIGENTYLVPQGDLRAYDVDLNPEAIHDAAAVQLPQDHQPHAGPSFVALSALPIEHASVSHPLSFTSSNLANSQNEAPVPSSQDQVDALL